MKDYSIRRYLAKYKGDDLLILIKPYAPLKNVDDAHAFMDVYYPAHQELYNEKRRLIKELTESGNEASDIDILYKDMMCEIGMGVRLKNQLVYIDGFGTFFTVKALKVKFAESLTGILPLPKTSYYPCENCDLCQRACPTKALDGNGGYNRERCIRNMQDSIIDEGMEFARAIGNRVLGCNNCQIVCPVNREIEGREYSATESEKFELEAFWRNTESGKEAWEFYEKYVGKNFARKMRFRSFLKIALKNRK